MHSGGRRFESSQHHFFVARAGVTVANGSFSFANGAGTLITSTLSSSQLTVGGNSVVTATALNPVLTVSELTCTSKVHTGSFTCTSLSVNGQSIVCNYLPLSAGTTLRAIQIA